MKKSKQDKRLRDMLVQLNDALSWANNLEHLGPFHPDPYWSKLYMMSRILGAPAKEAPAFAITIHKFLQSLTSKK